MRNGKNEIVCDRCLLPNDTLQRCYVIGGGSVMLCLACYNLMRTARLLLESEEEGTS